MTTASDDTLVTLDEAASRLSVPIGTLYSWVSRRILVPQFTEADGRRALFSLAEVHSRVLNTKRRNGRYAQRVEGDLGDARR